MVSKIFSSLLAPAKIPKDIIVIKKLIYLIGLIWLLLTLTFEFSLGLAGGHSWAEMLADYKIWEGKIWLLVPLTVFFRPVIVRTIVKLKRV